MKKLALALCAALSAAFLVTVGAASPSRAESKRFHGYCRCGCSTVPNCDTSADCGGGACSAAISCC